MVKLNLKISIPFVFVWKMNSCNKIVIWKKYCENEYFPRRQVQKVHSSPKQVTKVLCRGDPESGSQGQSTFGEECII